MGRIWGNLAVGFAVGALIAAFPALADTDTFSSTQTVSSQITDNTTDSTATNVVVNGGTVTLTNAANSYTGGTTVNSGSTLQVTVDGNLGAATGSITLGDATVPTTGATSANVGTLDLSQSTAAVTSSRAIVLDAGGGTIIAGTNPWTLSGTVSGAGLLTVTGGGTLVLSGSNTYSGGVAIIDDSTLKVSAPTNLSSGTITFGDAAGNDTHGTLDLTGTTAAETAANAIVINAGGGTIVTGPDAWTLSGVISGTGALTVSGTGTLIPTGANTYTGGTTIDGGATVQISADAQLGAAATTGGPIGVTLGNGTSTGTLELSTTSAVTSTLSLSLAAGGGNIDVTGDAWTIANPISGDGGLTLNGTGTGTGTLILNGANTYTGATTITAGTLELGDVSGTTASIAGAVTVASAGTLTGFGTIAGAVDSSGLVAPGISGKVGTLTVGSYSQSTSGTLSLLVTPTGTSELKVGGIADLAGTLHLILQGQLKAGTYQLISAGTINGTFASTTDVLSAALSEQTLYTPTAVDLIITQLTTLPENPTIFGDIESAEIDSGQAANTTLLSHLSGIRTGAAVDQMTMVNSSDHRAGASVGSSPYGAWAQGQGGFGSVNGSGSAPSYNVHGGGFMAGADVQIGRGGVLGAAIGYDITSLSESGGASASIDTPRVAVYGGYWWGPVAFDATAGIGIPSITSDRPVTQTGTTAAASYVGNEITAAFQASSTISLGDYTITPAIGTQYTRLNLHGLSESGAAGFDLDAPSSTTNSLRPFIAATASTRFFLDVRTVLEPTLRVAYSEEALSNSRQVTIIPSGDNTTFQFGGVKPSRGEASLDAGLVLETSHNLGFYTNAAVDGLGNSSGVKLDAGVRYRF